MLTAPAVIDWINSEVQPSQLIRLRPQPGESALARLTETSFDALALDPTKTTLAYFHASWSAECAKILQDVIWLVADAFASESRVVVGAVDIETEADLASK